MSMQYTLEQIVQALETFYSSNPTNIEAINALLCEFQKSRDAWSLSIQIMNTLNFSETIKLFAAQTLKTKLCYDFEEMKNEDQAQFKSMLLTFVISNQASERITAQLAQALGIYALHLNQVWRDTMIADFQACGDQAFLHILKALPEAAEDESIVTDEQNLIAFRRFLTSICSQVLEYLNSIPISQNSLLVFTSWVEMGLDEATLANLSSNPYLISCFAALARPDENFELVGKTVISLIEMTEDRKTHPQLWELLFTNVLALAPVCKQAIVNQDITVLEQFAAIFTELGRAHMELFTEATAETAILQVLEVLMEFFTHISLLESSRPITEFWYKFCRYIQFIENPELQKRQQEFFNPLFSRLAPIAVQHVKLSTGIMAQLEVNKPKHVIPEDLYQIRYFMSGVFSSLALAQGFETVHNMLHTSLASAVALPDQDEAACQMEALTLCLRCLGDCCHKVHMPIIKQSLSVLISLTVVKVALRNTTLDFIKSVQRHIDPEILLYVINYIVAGFANPLTQNDSAAVFQAVWKHNKIRLRDSIPNLMLIHNSINESMPVACSLAIVEGVSWVVCRSENSDHLVQMCQPFAGQILQWLETKNEVSKQKISENLDRISAVFKCCLDDDIPKAPMQAVFRQLWPVLVRILREYEESYNVIEEVGRVAKHAMRKLEGDFEEFLGDLVAIISDSFTRYHHSTYLYLAETIIRTFALSTPNTNNWMENLLYQMLGVVLPMLSTVEAFQENCDLAEDCFGMLIRYLRFYRQAVFSEAVFENIVVTAVVGVGTSNYESGKVLYSFLENLIDYAKDYNSKHNAYVETIVLKYYPELVKSALNCIINVPADWIFDTLSELLVYIFRANHLGQDWLRYGLTIVPHDCLTEVEKMNFIEECLTIRDVEKWLRLLYKRAKQRTLRTKNLAN